MTKGLWQAQIETAQNLERSLALDRPRALIQRATGSGKTHTAVTFVYRLIKHAGARGGGSSFQVAVSAMCAALASAAHIVTAIY